MSENDNKQENVLLLCLSKVNFNRGLTQYVYEGPEKKLEDIYGYMTNEAPAKVALGLVEKLDRIVVICSTDVNKPLKDISENQKLGIGIENEGDWEKVANNLGIPVGEKKQFLEKSSYDYYNTVITNYAIEKHKTIPKFRPISIPNDPEEQEIAKAAVQAADEIMGLPDEKKNIHLYIDYNGGLRYVASILLNTANLMEQRGVKIEKIFTMNIENKDGNGRVPVENFIGVLQSSRLVSGIREYINYGRCKELKRYFENCGDEEISDILTKMEALSDDFQLCDTDKIFGSNEVDELKESLEKYIKEHGQKKEEQNPYSTLFQYVANEILERYRPLFNKDLLDVLDWCIDNEYIQQAVTFYNERMPKYFWEHKIYYPTEEEERKYSQIKESCERLSNFEKAHEYQNLSDKEKNDIEFNAWKLGHGSNEGSLSNSSVKNALTQLHKYYLDRDWQACWMTKYLKYGDKCSWIEGTLKDKCKDFWEINFLISNGRVCSKIDDMSELSEIINEYHNIKDQRNIINHAEDSDKVNSSRWEYTTLVENLKSYVNRIHKFA